jgi:hypothetical protein
MLSLNFFNSNIARAYPVIALFQIDACQNVVTSLQYASFPIKNYGAKTIALKVLGLVVSLMLSVSLLYELTFLKQEISAYKKRKSLSDGLLRTLDQHLKLPLVKRLRKPSIDDSISKDYAVCMGIALVWLFLILDLAWVKAIFDNNIGVNDDEYSNWFYIGWTFKAISTSSIICSVILTVGLGKYSRIIVPQLSVMTLVLRRAVSMTLQFSKIAIFALIGFLVYFYLVVGPYSLYFSEIPYALMSLCQLAVGRWKAPVDVTEFVSVWYLIYGLVHFGFCRMVILILQIVKFQHNLKLVMHPKPARSLR